jgi:thiol:disulfide interchange protein DsbD
VTVDLIPLAEHIIPGEELELAVVFKMINGWHTYWRNPGDAGMATYFDWKLPEGFEVITILEPAPTRFTEEEVTSFIHEDEAIYVVLLKTPVGAPDRVSIGLNVDWLECKSICLAGSDSLTVELPVSRHSHNPSLELIHLRMKALSQIPTVSSEMIKRASIAGDSVSFVFKGFPKGFQGLEKIDFFPFDELVYDLGLLPRLKRGFWRDKVILHLLPGREKDPQALRGVLAVRPSSPRGAKTRYYEVNQPIFP